MEKIFTIVALILGALFLVFWCYIFYRRKIKGESADLKKRDNKGKIIK